MMEIFTFQPYNDILNAMLFLILFCLTGAISSFFGWCVLCSWLSIRKEYKNRNRHIPQKLD